MESKNHYDVVPASIADEDRIYEFLVENFFPDEPLNNTLGRIPQCKEESFSLHHIKNNLSFLAVERSNPLVICGVIINDERKCSNKYIDKQHQRKQRNTKLAAIGTFLGNCDEKLSIIQEDLKSHENEKTFEFVLLSVGKTGRNKGIAGKLIQKSMQFAMQNNYSWLAIQCTSFYSAAIAQSLGFDCVYEMSYCNYRDEDDNVIFKTKAPHLSFKAYLKYCPVHELES